jgi:hypothetical protein
MKFFFSASIFFQCLVIKALDPVLDPDLGPDPDWYSVSNVGSGSGINESGSERLV